MLRNRLLSLTIMIAILICGGSDIGAVTKVPARVNVMEFYGGASTAHGSYGEIRGVEWKEIFRFPGPNPSIDADNIFASSFNLGIGYGRLRNDHVLTSVGFRYTRVELDDVVIVRSDEVDLGLVGPDSAINENLYDITFDLNYFLNNITKKTWSPYVGVGFKGGLMVFSQEGFASQTDIKFSSAVNFGLDLKLWNDKANRTQVVLSSTNSFDFWATGNRPKYLNFGVGLKYYFRP